jgi:hypothetical protein
VADTSHVISNTKSLLLTINIVSFHVPWLCDQCDNSVAVVGKFASSFYEKKVREVTPNAKTNEEWESTSMNTKK